ncbi:hypothetical protein [Pseudomonas sp. DP-17]|uniref:hypothetical protein n=1 Tax=Pseudomonas sp. DP-17 TaxID=1580486 RepID=UPI001EFAAF74|nr:hypothetical protein [Pseudomonas sp. DP-17]MCG8911001.1 hypothetical protein [Pseudomonas sp. DP-17]
MHQQDVAKSELSALYLCLKSDATISLENIDPLRSGFEDRTYVRTVFSMFEGVAYATRQYILAQAAAGRYKISTQEHDLLSEQTYILDGKGKIKEKENFLQFIPGFRLTISVLGRCLGREEYVAGAFGHHMYDSFQNGVKIRNRIIHPKLTNDLMLSRAEVATVKEAHEWFDSLMLELIGHAFERHADPVDEGSA